MTPGVASAPTNANAKVPVSATATATYHQCMKLQMLLRRRMLIQQFSLFALRELTYISCYSAFISLIYIFLAIPVLGWNVTIFNLTATNFNLQWKKLYTVVNQYANFYIIEVKSIRGTVLTLENVPGNITSTVIKGLKPSSKYRVGVFGIDSTGQPYKSLESDITTKEGKNSID